MELKICEGDYGLPSLDADCLQLLLLGRVTKAPMKLKSRQAKYPIFYHENKRFSNVLEVQKYLVEIGYDADNSLSSKQNFEAYVLKHMLKLYLVPVLKYLWWINETNFDNFTAKWYMNSARFPFNFAGLRKLKNEALAFLQVTFPNESIETIKNILINRVKDCLPIFATKLQKSSYYFGEEISSLDIILYGYLAPILKIPFPQNEFLDSIENQQLFSKFVSRINRSFFPEVPYSEKYLKVTRSTSDEMEQNHPRIVFFFGFVVTMTIFGVGLSRALGKEDVR